MKKIASGNVASRDPAVPAAITHPIPPSGSHHEAVSIPHQPTPSATNHHVNYSMNARVAESAQLVGFLEQRVDQGYDWGPWRVVMSRRLGRPFFYNSVTKIGQFAVPPELNVVPSPTQSQASQLDGMEADHASSGHHQQWHMSAHNGSMPPTEGGGYTMHGTGLSATSAVGSSGGYDSNTHLHRAPTAERVMHYDHYLGEADEEESPFHMLWDSNAHEDAAFDELDPTAFLLSEHPPAHLSAPSSHGTSSASTAIATSTGESSTLVEGTASGTAIVLPQSTPFARGVAYSNTSSSSSHTRSAGNPVPTGGSSSPWVVDVEAETSSNDRTTRNSQTKAQSSQPHGAGSSSMQPTTWACQACTYLNDLTTYTCDICGTVDVQVQQSFSRPLLRSGHMLSTPGASNNNSAGRSQHQRGGSQAASQSQQQNKLTGSKLKPPASAAKPNKKAKK